MQNTTQTMATPFYQVALPPYMAVVSLALNIFVLLSNTIVLVKKFRKFKVNKSAVAHFARNNILVAQYRNLNR